jgi:hypothetical protein
MTCGNENITQDLQKLNLDQIIQRVENDVKKLSELERKIEDKSFKIKDLEIIQTGYMGVGANFFVGYKSNEELSKKFSEISIDN